MTLDNVFALAVKHLGSGSMESSARLCLADARALQAKGDYKHARLRALKSLAYSVGVSHSDYRKAAAVPRRHRHDFSDGDVCSGCDTVRA